jgi:hypothetical protein
MRYRGIGSLLLLASSFAWGQSASLPAPRHHGARRAVGTVPGQTSGGVPVFTSENWSGYAVIGSNFTQATGTWTVPAVDCASDPNSSASFWVGIDGWTNSTVEQTGTDSDCDGMHANYYAWIEFAPKAGITITSVPVSPGDQMLGEVSYDGAQFVVTTTNTTTGATYTMTAVVPEAKRASAEWIAEANGYYLSDFSTAHFGPDFTAIGTNSATDSSTSGPISAFGKKTQASVIVNGKGGDLAVPSFLSVDGTSFTVGWWAKE